MMAIFYFDVLEIEISFGEIYLILMQALLEKASAGISYKILWDLEFWCFSG
jgi:hypothetical protein